MDFSEYDYNLKINSFAFKIEETFNINELKTLKLEIQEYIESCKLRHFAYILNEDYEKLEELINQKTKTLKHDRYKEIV